MGLEAATKALLDAGITYDAVQAAFVGYCYGDSTSGQVGILLIQIFVLKSITYVDICVLIESSIQSRPDWNTD